MMTRLLRAACLVALAQPAFAQDVRRPALSGYQPQLRSEATAEGRQFVHDYAACLLRSNRSAALSLLAMDFRTSAYRGALRRLVAESDCNRQRWFASAGVLVTGALAEAALAAQSGADLAARTQPNAARPPLDARVPSEFMASCVVLGQPDAVFRLFSTAPGSTEETQAADALLPSVARCLRSGQRSGTSAAGLRSVLALAALRLVRHNAGEQVS